MQTLHLPPTSNLPLEQRVSQQKNYLPVLCDVRIRSTVLTSLQTALAQFGSIDIIVSCASYGIVGACEDQSEPDIRGQFETNFMGALNIIQLSLPYFRKCQAGRYVIFNDTSGALGLPGLGPYCATKYAVEGLIESMLYEVESFGVKATLVLGGPMRRDENPDEVKKRTSLTHDHTKTAILGARTGQESQQTRNSNASTTSMFDLPVNPTLAPRRPPAISSAPSSGSVTTSPPQLSNLRSSYGSLAIAHSHLCDYCWAITQ